MSVLTELKNSSRLAAGLVIAYAVTFTMVASTLAQRNVLERRPGLVVGRVGRRCRADAQSRRGRVGPLDDVRRTAKPPGNAANQPRFSRRACRGANRGPAAPVRVAPTGPFVGGNRRESRFQEVSASTLPLAASQRAPRSLPAKPQAAGSTVRSG